MCRRWGGVVLVGSEGTGPREHGRGKYYVEDTYAVSYLCVSFLLTVL